MIERNAVYYPLTQSRERYRVVFGGAGSGKSVGVAQDYVDLIGSTPGTRLLCLRKVQSTCRYSTFDLFKQIIGASGRLSRCRVLEVPMTIGFPSGGDIIHAGLDDVKKLKSIAGVTHIWVEEATELHFPSKSATKEPDIAQIDLRLRGVPQELRPHITLTFNPTPVARKLLDYLQVDESQLPNRGWKVVNDVFIQHTTHLDNRWVNPDEYLKVFRRLGGAMQDIYERGVLASADEPDQLIKYSWVKSALERPVSEAWTDGRMRLGADIARFGNDETSIGWGEGFALQGVETRSGIDTHTTGLRIATLGRLHKIAAEMCAVDDVGLGGGSVDTARATGFNVTAFSAGSGALESLKMPDGSCALPAMPKGMKFNMLRSQAYFYYRMMLEAGHIAYSSDLSEDDKVKLKEDLLAPRYRIARESTIEVEPKLGNDRWGIKNRLGRSPDLGDMETIRVFGEHCIARIQPGYRSVSG